MKKLFFAICFNIVLIGVAWSRVTPITGYENIPAQNNADQEPEVHEINLDDFQDMVREGFKKAQKANPKDINRNVGYIPSFLRQKQKEQGEKGFFQKIYEDALKRIELPGNEKREDVSSSENIADADMDADDTSSQEELQKQWQNPQVPVVTAYLPPDNTPTQVPALEHISYLMNSIEVLPTGSVKFEETIVVVANGEKLHHGLTKILPSKIYNASGKFQKLDYSVIGVSINNTPIDYHISSNGNKILLVPDKNYKLAPGIYTYTFEYLVDNLLIDNNNDYLFYWDVGGNGWNLIVDRLGASLNIPMENAITEQQVLLGMPGRLSNEYIFAQPNGKFATAYIANRPLFIGEGMHIIAYISKSALLPPTLWQHIMRAFYNNGDIYLAFLGLLIITLSFVISWRFIAQNKGQLKFTLNKTAMVIRYFMYNRFDIKSVCGFLLEMYKKNIIDIQQSGDTILLIKRTDNLKGLEKYEQKALYNLFPAHETVFNVNKQNKLPFKRFVTALEHGIKRYMLKFRLKLNTGYFIFSFVMLFMTELFIAMFKPNCFYIYTVMVITTLVATASVLLWQLNCRRWLKLISKFFAVDILLLCLIILSAVVHPIAAILLLLAPIVIMIALNVYSRRLGLIKYYIQDVAKFKDYLITHHDNIVVSKNFLNYQAAIWAYDMEKDFVPTGHPEYYKLPIMKNIIDCF